MNLFKYFLFFAPLLALVFYSCGDDPARGGSGRVLVAQFVSAGSTHTCAVLDDESLKCWGSNQDGVIGDGTFTDRPTPTAVDFTIDGAPESVVAGDNHTCALMDSSSDNSLVCWGSNRFG